jgi:hypothetical protein
MLQSTAGSQTSAIVGHPGGPGKKVTNQVTAPPGNARPHETSSDATPGPTCGNRTYPDTVRRNPAAWHAEGRSSLVLGMRRCRLCRARSGLSRLGLRVAPFGLSNWLVVRLLLSRRGRALLVHHWFKPADGCCWPGHGPVSGRGARQGFRVDGPWVSGPGGEPFPKPSHIRIAEPYLGKYAIIHLV